MICLTIRHLAPFVAAACLAGGPALAQQADPAAVAKAQAEGDALLAAGNATDLFDNETAKEGSGAILLRHRKSGVRCLLNRGKPVNKVTVYPGLVRGNDVSCTTLTITDLRTLFITYEPSKTNTELMELEVKAVQIGDPGSKPYTPKARKGPSLRPPPNLKIPEHLTTSLRGGRDDYLVKLGKLGPWAVKQRFQGPAVGEMGDLLEVFWVMTALDQARYVPPAAVAPAAAPPRAGPEALAAAKAEADSIVTAAGAGDLAQNVTEGALPKLRLKGSGLVCTFAAGQPDNRLEISTRRARGDDIACHTRVDGALHTVYAVKMPIPMNLELAHRVYMSDIRNAHPDVKPAKGTFGDVVVDRKDGRTPPLRRTSRLTYEVEGQPAFSRLSVAVIPDWIIEQRVTAPMKDALVSDLAAEMMMSELLDSVTPPARR